MNNNENRENNNAFSTVENSQNITDVDESDNNNINSSNDIDRLTEPTATIDGSVRKKRKPGIMILSIGLIIISSLLVFAGAFLVSSMSKFQFDHEISEISFNPDDFKPDGEINPDNHAHENPTLGQRFDSLSKIPIYGNTNKVTNILLLGIDSENSSMAGRSDAIIILTLNHETKTIKMTSLLRDIMVVIPGRDLNGDGKDDYDKLNHAYAYGNGRPDLLIETIKYNFRIEINQYIAVNFRAFEKAVDAFNGIDIDLTAAEASHIGVGWAADNYHLNGVKALDYARIRKLDTDFGRTERQRKVLSQIIAKAKKMNVLQLNKMVNTVFPQVTTNLTPDELLGFLNFTSYSMGKTYFLPEEGGYTNHIYSIGFVFQLENPTESVGKLHDFIYN